MTYSELQLTDDLSYTVPTKLNENARKARFLNAVAHSADFTVWADDAAGIPRDLYAVTTGASTIVASLPTIASGDAAAGRVVTIMKIDAGGGAVSIDPDGSETINGSATPVSLSTQYHYRTLVYDGASGWIVISSS
tara:strand:+ start:205 stop:612 length:408 start_codon:yes stop_codon:yes gene_type:complete